MVTYWAGLDTQIQSALIGVAGTFATAILALLGLKWQLGNQAQQSQEDIAENERRRLKAGMHEDTVARTRDLIDTSIALATPLRVLATFLKSAAPAVAAGQPPPIPSARLSNFLAQYDDFTQAVLRFIFLVEERRFVDPRLLVFRTAMNVTLHDARELFYPRLMVALADSLPIDGPDGKMLRYKFPSPQTADALYQMIEKFIAALEDAGSYAEDFSVEMQNLLLADLFGHQVAHRVPIDPAAKVITLDKAEQLENWFNASTAWGQQFAKVEAEVAQQFAPQNAEAQHGR